MINTEKEQTKRFEVFDGVTRSAATAPVVLLL